jgi:hypothetical protein
MDKHPSAPPVVAVYAVRQKQGHCTFPATFLAPETSEKNNDHRSLHRADAIRIRTDAKERWRCCAAAYASDAEVFGGGGPQMGK